MTYDEIEAELLKNDLWHELDTLRHAVTEEAATLAQTMFGERPSEAAVRRNEPAAREFFAADVAHWLATGEPLLPRGILSHRHRFCVTWAVAQILMQARGKA